MTAGLTSREALNSPDFLAKDELEKVDYVLALEGLEIVEKSSFCGRVLARLVDDPERLEAMLARVDGHFAQKPEWSGLRARFLNSAIDLAEHRGDEAAARARLEPALKALRLRLSQPSREHRDDYLLMSLKILAKSMQVSRRWAHYLDEFLVVCSELQANFVTHLMPLLQRLPGAVQRAYARRTPDPGLGTFLKLASQPQTPSKALDQVIEDCLAAEQGLRLVLLAGAWAVSRGDENSADIWFEGLTRLADLEQIPEWIVERVANLSHRRGDHRQALRLYRHLALTQPDIPLRGTRLAPGLLAGASAFYAGDYSQARRFLEGDQGERADLQAMLVRSWEALGESEKIGPFLASLQRDAPLEMQHRGLRGELPALEAEYSSLTAIQLEQVRAKLARPDLVCHALHSLRSLRKVEVLPMLVHTPEGQVDGQQALQSLREALAFYERELGLACPQFRVAAPEETRDCGEEIDPQSWSWNAHGRVASLLPQRAKANQTLISFYVTPNDPFGGGVSTRQSQRDEACVRLGHHRPSQSNLVAHELGHSVFELEDVQDTRPLEGGLSVMGYDWNGPVHCTYLGLRYKAGCLTTGEAQREIDLGRRAEDKKSWTRASRHYGRAWQLDPWHLAVGLRCVWVLKKLNQTVEAESIAAAVQERYPSVGIEVRLADILGYRHFRTAPELLTEADRRLVADWHLKHGRNSAALPYLRGLEQNPRLLCRLGYAALNRWSLDEALGLFRKALQWAPHDWDGREAHATCLCFLGRAQEAREEFAIAQELRGSAPRPAKYDYYLRLARGGSLRNLLLRLTKKYDKVAHWQLQLGIVEHESGRPVAALECFKEARRLRRGALEQAYLSWQEGQLEAAAAQARQALRASRSRPAALELLARLEPQKGWEKRLFGWLPNWPALLIPRPTP